MNTAVFMSAGFYFANTVSLSFGTLAVNDVVAAGVTVAFCEVLPAHIFPRCVAPGYSNPNDCCPDADCTCGFSVQSD